MSSLSDLKINPTDCILIYSTSIQTQESLVKQLIPLHNRGTFLYGDVPENWKEIADIQAIEDLTKYIHANSDPKDTHINTVIFNGTGMRDFVERQFLLNSRHYKTRLFICSSKKTKEMRASADWFFLDLTTLTAENFDYNNNYLSHHYQLESKEDVKEFIKSHSSFKWAVFHNYSTTKEHFFF